MESGEPRPQGRRAGNEAGPRRAGDTHHERTHQRSRPGAGTATPSARCVASWRLGRPDPGHRGRARPVDYQFHVVSAPAAAARPSNQENYERDNSSGVGGRNGSGSAKRPQHVGRDAGHVVVVAVDGPARRTTEIEPTEKTAPPPGVSKKTMSARTHGSGDGKAIDAAELLLGPQHVRTELGGRREHDGVAGRAEALRRSGRSPGRRPRRRGRTSRCGRRPRRRGSRPPATAERRRRRGSGWPARSPGRRSRSPTSWFGARPSRRHRPPYSPPNAW